MKTLLLKVLSVATGELPHRFDGLCPDPMEGPNVRDPDCPACRVLIEADKFLAEKTGKWTEVGSVGSQNSPSIDAIKTIVFLLDVEKNAEGSSLAYLSVEGAGVGFRIAGPKAWGGSQNLARLKFTDDDLVRFIKEYAPDVISKLRL